MRGKQLPDYRKEIEELQALPVDRPLRGSLRM
jgi:hypothetical protein